MSNEKNTREQRLAAAMKRLDKEGPLPGMISAFEQQFGQTWTDREWRSETSVWACAWRAALSTQRQAEPEDDGGYYSEEADDIEQSRARAEVTDVQQWLPIETVPKDKTLLLWHPSYGTPVAGHLIASDLWAAFTPGVSMLFQKHLESPTHWMPLPQPPAMQKETK